MFNAKHIKVLQDKVFRDQKTSNPKAQEWIDVDLPPSTTANSKKYHQSTKEKASASSPGCSHPTLEKEVPVIVNDLLANDHLTKSESATHNDLDAVFEVITRSLHKNPTANQSRGQDESYRLLSVLESLSNGDAFMLIYIETQRGLLQVAADDETLLLINQAIKEEIRRQWDVCPVAERAGGVDDFFQLCTEESETPQKMLPS